MVAINIALLKMVSHVGEALKLIKTIAMKNVGTG